MTPISRRFAVAILGLATLPPALPAGTRAETRTQPTIDTSRMLAMARPGGFARPGGMIRPATMPGPGPWISPGPPIGSGVAPWVIPSPIPLPGSYPVVPVVPDSSQPSGVTDVEEPAEELVTRSCRYLRVKNETGGKLTLSLQYRTETTKGEMKWYPGDPRTSTETVVFELAAGQETSLKHDGWTINASRVRIWAVADNGDEWNENKDKDLWLVPEADKAGRHYYSAPKMETFTHTFAR